MGSSIPIKTGEHYQSKLPHKPKEHRLSLNGSQARDETSNQLSTVIDDLYADDHFACNQDRKTAKEEFCNLLGEVNAKSWE